MSAGAGSPGIIFVFLLMFFLKGVIYVFIWVVKFNARRILSRVSCFCLQLRYSTCVGFYFCYSACAILYGFLFPCCLMFSLAFCVCVSLFRGPFGLFGFGMRCSHVSFLFYFCFVFNDFVYFTPCVVCLCLK